MAGNKAKRRGSAKPKSSPAAAKVIARARRAARKLSSEAAPTEVSAARGQRSVAPRGEASSAAHVGPALALLEISEVPRGLRALDALVKEAPVTVAARGTVQCGRYLIAFAGEVEAVERAHARALSVAGGAVTDAVLLPDAEPRILPALRDGVVRWPAPGDALGVLQSGSCPVLLAAVDAALKGAHVELVELRLADGLGGRAIATFWGEIYDVEAAMELSERALGRHAERVGVGREEASMVVIPNADDETRLAVSAGTRFFGEWRG